ncbi:MAG: molybdenum cofactor biosynthesis protein MoeB [Gemmatimonadetes bacterium]|nr:molybdenum cofactor biosynthesis protein MoeB [Gemmatimonadota bacterium]
MQTEILIPTPLRRFSNNESSVFVEATTVGEAFERLVVDHPELRRHLFAESGALRSYVNVFLGDEDIRHLRGVETPLEAGVLLTIVPAIAGGSGADLDAGEIARYSRHLILPEVGMGGQRKLKAASVLLVGTGGLGSPLGMYLAAAGVGRIGLVDFDVVDHSNLQRQIIHGTKNVGRPKLESARERILDINPRTVVDLYDTRLSSDNAREIVRLYDLVIDGTDNFPTRYLVNDVCVLEGKPNVYGSIFRFEGQSSVFWAERGPCYRCLYPDPPPPGLVPSCAEGGVLGVLPGIIGTIQATEGIKLLLGRGEPLIGRLLLFDALDMRFRELKLRSDPACPVCGESPTIREPIDYEAFCGVVPAQHHPEEWDVSPRELMERLRRGDRLVLLDVRSPQEWEICRLPDARHIPVDDLPSRVRELDSTDEIVVYCKMGVRSATAARFLKDAGFGRLRNLQGGILAWADQIDSSVPKY